MRIRLRHVVAVSILHASPAVWADVGGSCHFHGSKPAEASTVAGCAAQRKEALVKSGKLEPSWRTVAHDKVETIDGKKGKEWRVTFRDPAAKDKARETLTMFFTLPGNFIAANFDGK